MIAHGGLIGKVCELKGCGGEADFSTAGHKGVSGFGRNGDSRFGWKEKQQQLRFGLERIGLRGMIVTLGVLRCAQNDGKRLIAVKTNVR